MQYSLRTDLPAATGYRMPPEWVPHERCWMAWPCRDETYHGFLSQARDGYAACAHAIAEFEPVTMVVRPADEADARKRLSHEVEIFPAAIDDAWLRDSGPTFVISDNGDVAGVDWCFNAWGYKYAPWDKDETVAGEILRHLSLPRFLAPLVLEGGSIHTDGDGVLLTTEQCLLHPNRNPRLKRSEIEELLQAYLGVREVLWLAGDLRDIETDGHIDNVACFVAPGRVLFMQGDDDSLRQNEARLAAARRGDGTPYELIPLPRPVVNGEVAANFLPSYVNFYVANGGIVMPAFGVATDAAARETIASVFPDRRVVQINACDIVRGGGGIHCITQQQPASS